MTPFSQAPLWLRLHKLGLEVPGVAAVRLSITPILTRSRKCVIVINLGWYEKLSELLDQTYATVKMGDSGGNGRWRPFTLVLTGYQIVTDLEKPEHKEDVN